MQRRSRLPPKRLVSLVDLEPRRFKVLYDSLGELAASIVWRMLADESGQQIAAAGDREANREVAFGLGTLPFIAAF